MSKLMGSTSLALVEEYRKQQASQKLRIHQPRAADLMAQLFKEIIAIIGDVEVTPMIEIEGDSISMSFKANNSKQAPVLRTALRNLEEECEIDGIDVNPMYYRITADDHLTMHQLLATIVISSPELIVPEKAQPSTVMANTKENRDGFIGLKTVSSDYRRGQELVLSKFYNSREEYDASVYLASKANLSISLNHIYTCILREEGKEIPKQDLINPGGYH